MEVIIFNSKCRFAIAIIFNLIFSIGYAHAQTAEEEVSPTPALGKAMTKQLNELTLAMDNCISLLKTQGRSPESAHVCTTMTTSTEKFYEVLDPLKTNSPEVYLSVVVVLQEKLAMIYQLMKR